MATGAFAPYDPNPVLAALYRRFFEHIEVDPAWTSRMREAEARGTVVYIMRNLSFVDFLALDYLTKRHGLPPVRFVNDTGLFLLEPMGRGWWNAISKTAAELLGAGTQAWDDGERLRSVLLQGGSAALFLKRPPGLFEGTRGRIEGDALLSTILQLSEAGGSRMSRPIILCPLVFIWSRGQDRAERAPIDLLLGPREWPGKLRTVAQFLMNYRHVTLRAGEPLDVRAFVAAQARESGAPATVNEHDAWVRRMTYTLLRRLERERKTVTGPTQKPSDRVREEVVRSPKLQRIIADLAGPGEAERRVITERARDMVKELEASLDENAVAVLDRTFDATIARMYESFEVDEAGLRRLQELSRNGTLVLLPSHKSHVDYIILTRTFYRAKMPIPLVAAGDNLNFFPLGPVFRKSGAFFIRRKFQGDRLYAAVVDAYMRRLMKDGYPIEFFLEGGRSRTGKLLTPKLGLLSMVVDAALGTTTKQVYFCPISIGYERMVEEDAYVDEMSGGEKKKEDVRGLLRTASVLSRQYGRISIQFGEPLTLERVRKEMGVPDGAELTPAKRRAMITRLGHWVMNEINRVSAVTPGALAATVMLGHGGRAVSDEALLRGARELIQFLRTVDARFSPSLFQADGVTMDTRAIRRACVLFQRAGHVRVLAEGQRRGRRRLRPADGVYYSVEPLSRLPLDQAKSTIVHFFVSRALVATCLLAGRAHRSGLALPEIRERAQLLSRMFKFEFAFRADASFEENFDDTVRALKDESIVRDGARISLRESRRSITLEGIGPGAGDSVETLDVIAEDRARHYALMIKNYVEGYRVMARALQQLVRAPALQKDLVRRALTVGERMFLDGVIDRREAVLSPILENAIAAFIDQGFLLRRDGKLALAESFATDEAVTAIEAKVASFLVRERSFDM